MTKEDLKFFIPYVGTTVVLMGAIKLIIYYSLFHLAITPYLEFTEIITLFLSDILYFIAILFIQNVLMFLAQPSSELENISAGLHNVLTENSFFRRVYAYAINGINLIMLAGLWIVGIPFWIIFSNYPFGIYLWFLYSLIALLVLLTVIYEIRRQWLVKFKTHPKMLYTNLAKIFIVLLILTIYSAYSEYNAARYHQKYTGTVIVLKDKSITCDSNQYYIGKTKNFIFLHNQKTSANDIIPLTEVKMISERKNDY